MIVYHQTHHRNEQTVSLLPLLTKNTGVTHVIVAAIHLNDGSPNITLNDTHPSDPRFSTLWSEVAWLQGAGVKVLGMLGGAAKGSYARLSGDQASFEAYYAPLHNLIQTRCLSGLDLDVEEPTTLGTMTRLIERLRADFGPEFLITLAPVSTALLPDAILEPNKYNLSGFCYQILEASHGSHISWYNAQFYCGWGDLANTQLYDAILASGWDPRKVVVGTTTNPANGSGWVRWHTLQRTLGELRRRLGDRFGGVMGWEYFNSLGPDGVGEEGTERPWEWARMVGRCVTAEVHASGAEQLMVLGFSRAQAEAALRAAGGNVEYAAGLLFQD